MESCLEGIDAILVKGYCVVENGKSVRSFHHGGFIMKLREAASQTKGVETIEAMVTDPIQADFTRRISAVRVSRKVDGQDFKECLFADPHRRQLFLQI